MISLYAHYMFLVMNDTMAEDSFSSVKSILEEEIWFAYYVIGNVFHS